MHVTISRELKLAGLENVYVFLSEGRKPKLDVPSEFNKVLQSTIRTSGFTGRKDETVSVLAGTPKRLTLVGLGDAKKLSHKAIRAIVRTVGVSAFGTDSPSTTVRAVSAAKPTVNPARPRAGR